MPAGLRAASGRKVISYSVLLRKHVGRDARLLVRTQLFSTTFGADFRCVVAESMRTTGAWISGGEVSTLGPAPSMVSSVDLVQGLPVDLHVRYDAPLQSGSTIGFHLTRAVD